MISKKKEILEISKCIQLSFLSHISFIFQHFSRPLKCSRRGQPQFFISWNFFHLCLETTSISFLLILDPCQCRSYLWRHLISSQQTHMCGSRLVSIYLSFRAAQDVRPGNRMLAPQNQAERGKIILGLQSIRVGCKIAQGASLFRFLNQYVAKWNM